MSIERCLVCDRCSAIIAAADSVKLVRKDAKNLYQIINGKDVCTTCEPLPHNRRKD